MHLTLDTPGADKAVVTFNGESTKDWGLLSANDEEGWIICERPGNAKPEMNGPDIVPKKMVGTVKIEMPDGGHQTKNKNRPVFGKKKTSEPETSQEGGHPEESAPPQAKGH